MDSSGSRVPVTRRHVDSTVRIAFRNWSRVNRFLSNKLSSSVNDMVSLASAKDRISYLPTCCGVDTTFRKVW